MSMGLGELRGLAVNPLDPDEYATAGDDGVVMVWSVSVRVDNYEWICRVNYIFFLFTSNFFNFFCSFSVLCSAATACARCQWGWPHGRCHVSCHTTIDTIIHHIHTYTEYTH
jgi:hypothetical protein